MSEEPKDYDYYAKQRGYRDAKHERAEDNKFQRKLTRTPNHVKEHMQEYWNKK